MADKRSEPRYMCADLVKIRIQEASGSREEIANLEDISASGACVQLEAAAMEGADIEMTCAKCCLKGKVQYCRFAQTGYDVGIMFDRSGSWNRRRFMPKHLLNVKIGKVNGPDDQAPGGAKLP